MLSSFPHTLRRFGLEVDVRLLLELYQTMEMGLVTNLGSLFEVGQHLIVKSKRDMGPYLLAFWDYFLGIEVKGYRTIEEAIYHSPSFEHWYSQRFPTGEVDPEIPYEQLIDQFLHETLHSDLSLNIQKELSARDLLNKDNPTMQDMDDPHVPPRPPQMTDTMVDYSEIPLSELMERMKQVAEQQKALHRGGNHWIGTHGASPYGHSGLGVHGIRVGGKGHAASARKVMGDPTFFPIDLDAPVNDDNMDAALQSLKELTEHHSDLFLDVEKTVNQMGKHAGVLVPYFRKEKFDQIQVLLLIDNGGNSMRSHAEKVRHLFSKMTRRFSHDLQIYYFHNAIYDHVYADETREIPVPLGRIMSNSSDCKLFIVGDAYMGPHELLSAYGAIEYREESSTPSIENLQALKTQFTHTVWINPIAKQYWTHTLVPIIQKIMPIEPLTLNGLRNAIRYMMKDHETL